MKVLLHKAADKYLNRLHLLSALAEPLYTIETATPEETKRAEKRIREYHKDPSSFVPFKKRVTGNG